MKSEVISFFYDFKCIAENCEDNCCKSWNLIVDDETVKKYRDMQGALGRKLKGSIRKDPNGSYCLKTCFGKCRFQDKSGLCRLQCEGCGELMPMVCRLFPRYTVSYGGYVIGVIDLSCMTAAELFLNSEGKARFIEAPEDIEVYWHLPEADYSFAEILRADLELITDRIWADEKRSLWETEKEVFAHVYAHHLRLVKGEIAPADDLPFDISVIESTEGEKPHIVKERYKDIYRDLPLIPMGFINKVIYKGFPEVYLFLYHPKARKLLKAYKRKFGKVYERQADELFCRKLEGMYEKYDWLEGKLRSYFSYKLQVLYMGASVDYYLIEPVMMAMISTQMLILLLITHNEKGKETTIETVAGIIVEVERLLSHNVSLRDKLMQRVRDELF